MDTVDPGLRFVQLLGRHRDRQPRQHLAPVLAFEQRPLGLGVGIAQFDPHQKAVQLRFGQRKGADLIGGVLGGDDEKRLRQRAGLALDGDLPLLHRFQQGALGLGRGAVDFVGQNQLGENRAGMEHESLALALVHRRAENVRRQQVAGELDALILQTEAARQGVRQGGFAHAGQVFDQQMTARQQAGDGQADGALLAEDDRAHLPDREVQAILQDGRHVNPAGAGRA